MSGHKQVAIISASPKPPGRAASDILAGMAADALHGENIDVSVINARETLQKRGTDAAFQTMADADALIIIFPLYIFCLPGITMRFLQMYRDYAAKLPARKKAAVYSVINCGFPEPEINEEASRVIGRFASAVGAQYCHGILIGSGGMLTLNVPPAKKALAQYLETFKRMRAEIAGGVIAPADHVLLRVDFPRKLYFLMGNMGWRRQISKNGGKKKDLCRRPYQ